ncbi:MAG: hypothetical protein L0332_03360 [Chloroflexi bacterium]|nr:hypothetical protein [Chloroflexota bacterium]MCI0579666.1 hypothetical protein [Chloroflexota bacterium]MCI0645894.1 hypothetical protein [Chloroflexota bacterium]MCI0725749.1 hypothetical protein [Chloroflexota bacterium]
MEFVPLTTEHVDQFVALFQREKGTVRAHQLAEHLPWSFFDQPLARPELPVVEVVVEDGRVLGCMGAIPQTILDGEKEIQGAFFVDWLVDSAQRRRKIGSQLILRAAERFPVSVHMGSTPEGYATCATLGAQDCGRTVTARRILQPGNWAKGTDKGNFLTRLAWSGAQTIRARALPSLEAGGLTVRPVEPMAIDRQLASFSRQLAQSHVCTLRFGARWQWLVAQSPLYTGYACEISRSGEVIGYAALVVAFRSHRRVGTVADVCVGRIEDAPAVVAAATGELAGQGVDGVALTVSTGVAEQVIGQLGFEQLGDPMMGAWLHPGYDYLLDRPWFMTGAENLSIAAGIDLPVRAPVLNSGNSR